ncbi:MAG: ATP-binding cassette domain-containing protein [Clostridiales bacterium]|jgi:putative ABC transport system ATP-binding protein/lipoprotein-releasing system ATP-binding protein|nr:ATP-binding cassette domain-containing protein [Eubacteriales bacterium]MDH7566691.1 ATP-binding cassette domain-containing protein [Clostridiales bacterium]
MSAEYYMDKPDCFIKVENAVRTYNQGGIRVEALKSASCRVLPHDRIAVVGPSGSGKSSLLHIMGGLDKPTTGSVSWPLLGGPESLRPGRLGFVSQTRSLVSSLNVLENIALPLLLLDHDYEEAKNTAEDLLRIMGLMDIANKQPDELSGGQLQRAAVARALSTRPKVILADEPTGQLDHTTADHLLGVLFEHIRDTDTALVIATHDRDVARRMDKKWKMQYGILEVEAV